MPKAAPPPSSDAADAPPAPPVTEKELAFKLRGGTPCLYLVETLGEWTGRRYERIYDAERWRVWLRLVKLPDPAQKVTNTDLEHMRTLRRAIYGVAQAVRTGAVPRRDDVDTINAYAAAATPIPQLNAQGTAAMDAQRCTQAQILSVIARDAIGLIVGPLRDRIRECARPKCPVLFVDRSRPGDRIWCSVACGSRKATAKYRQKLAGQPFDEDSDFCRNYH
ncbi:ABATE domain-containing protein [Bordetella sp. N]|uniref:CGNR zinc finger domain-containing protein n=1 Tax=Bordetella sp. N TaxID=1746199 RepID=UPI00070B9C91|nr:CGNR zinc finger domain-containing protein [Bordetella sp. N]ALM82832.1 hypothetical protein ASB57_07595 [Bordetella sp. N]